jgi:hypothetical protein
MDSVAHTLQGETNNKQTRDFGFCLAYRVAIYIRVDKCKGTTMCQKNHIRSLVWTRDQRGAWYMRVLNGRRMEERMFSTENFFVC